MNQQHNLWHGTGFSHPRTLARTEQGKEKEGSALPATRRLEKIDTESRASSRRRGSAAAPPHTPHRCFTYHSGIPSKRYNSRVSSQAGVKGNRQDRPGQNPIGLNKCIFLYRPGMFPRQADPRGLGPEPGHSRPNKQGLNVLHQQNCDPQPIAYSQLSRWVSILSWFTT